MRSKAHKRHHAGAPGPAASAKAPRGPATTRHTSASTPRPNSANPAAMRSAPRRQPAHFRRRRLGFWTKVTLTVGGAVAVLAVIFFVSTAGRSKGGSGLAGAYPFQVAQPGPSQKAPTFALPATDGTTFDLAATRGKTVLLFFQEGLGCEPCWTQIKDIERQWGQFHGSGIDQFVTITTNPLDALKQKVTDEGIKTPVLADERFTVSLAYHANEYGMMGNSADGHSFVLVGPDGTITWRADYGGPPDYTMYVPVANLIADMKEGLHEAKP